MSQYLYENMKFGYTSTITFNFVRATTDEINVIFVGMMHCIVALYIRSPQVNDRIIHMNFNLFLIALTATTLQI